MALRTLKVATLAARARPSVVTMARERPGARRILRTACVTSRTTPSPRSIGPPCAAILRVRCRRGGKGLGMRRLLLHALALRAHVEQPALQHLLLAVDDDLAHQHALDA